MKKSAWYLRWIERFGRVANILHILLMLACGFAGAWLLGGVLDLGLAGYVIGFVVGVFVLLGGI